MFTEDKKMFVIEHNKNTGTISLGQGVKVTGNPNFRWNNVPVEAKIHKVEDNESIWFYLFIKQIGEISWESTIRMRAPGSERPIEKKFDKYFHTHIEALEAIWEEYPDEYDAIFRELFS